MTEAGDDILWQFRRLVEQFPASAEAHYNLANALYSTGVVDEAIANFRRAVALRPDFAEAWSNLAVVLLHNADVAAAIACAQQALELKPNDPRAYNNLGNALKECGRLDEAVACYSEALRLAPDLADAYFNLGCAQQMRGQRDEAARCFDHALKLKSDHVPALINLGNLQCAKRRPTEAADSFRKAIELAPGMADAYNGLGAALLDLGRPDEAIKSLRRAAELQPGHAPALSNLGNAFKALGQIDEAIQWYRRAAAERPNEPEIACNLGLALIDDGNLQEAENCFNRVINECPDKAHAHYGRSLIWLLRGDFSRGWLEHEWRWKCDEWLSHCNEQPLDRLPVWDGASLDGKIILLRCEQGLGDTLQFVRYAQLVKERGGGVFIECQKPLVNMLARCPGIDRIIARGDAMPAFDVQAPLMSLPPIFQTTLQSIPANVPYVFADPELVGLWGKKIDSAREDLEHRGFQGHYGVRSLVIGINWRGRTTPGIHKQRDIPLQHFAALAAMPSVRLICLQKGGAGEISSSGVSIVDFGDELDARHGAFMDTAAIMMNLDLVITSDTSVAHLAGALGVPVWVALPLVPDWRGCWSRAIARGIRRCDYFGRRAAGIGRGCSQRLKPPCGRG